MIYFDNAATTVVDDEVLDTFVKLTKKLIGNPSSVNGKGQEASNFLEKAREQIASTLHLNRNKEVIFTSGATESNNMAIEGICSRYKKVGKHIITTEVEHPSVLNVFKKLENEGFEVTYLKVDNKGQISLEELKNAMREDTILVSIMAVNNEIGTIYPIEEASKIVKEYKNAFFMVDATQGIGKVRINFNDVDIFSMSSHKIKGLKSVGLLVKDRKINLDPIVEGGGQENGLRSGTMNAPLCCSLATALRKYFASFDTRYKKAKELNSYLRNELSKMGDEIIILSDENESSPYILNFALTHYKASVVVEALSQREVYISTKSACSEHSKSSSSVIQKMGYDESVASNALRLSFEGVEDVSKGEEFIKIFKEVLSKLKRI